MKKSTFISIIVVLFFSAIAGFAFSPSPAGPTKFNGYNSIDALKIIVVSKSIRQGGSSGRSNSGGGSSYGK